MRSSCRPPQTRLTLTSPSLQVYWMYCDRSDWPRDLDRVANRRFFGWGNSRRRSGPARTCQEMIKRLSWDVAWCVCVRRPRASYLCDPFPAKNADVYVWHQLWSCNDTPTSSLTRCLSSFQEFFSLKWPVREPAWVPHRTPPCLMSSSPLLTENLLAVAPPTGIAIKYGIISFKFPNA